MKTTITTCLLAAALLLAAPANASVKKFDKAMGPLLSEYLKITASLAADTLDGVAAAAAKIKKLAVKLPAAKASGKHAAKYEKLPAKIKAGAAAVGEAKGIKAVRQAFKKLSKPMVLWAALSQPAGLNTVYCSMAPGAWLQRDKTIANPYYGASMLRCGEIIAGKDKGATGGHMKKK